MTAPTPTDSGGRYDRLYMLTKKDTGKGESFYGILSLFLKKQDALHDAGIKYDVNEVYLLPASTYTRLLAIEAAAVALIDGTGGKSTTTEYGECYVPQDADFERLAGVVVE